jgi:phospholipid/cholesterol/gamma-HCH transport system substrate-binding protein
MGMTAFQRITAGALSTVLLLALLYFGTQWALGALDDDYRVWVTVGDLGVGVVEGTDVKMRGVIVGAVGERRLNDNYESEVELVLEPQYEIPERATFAVTGKTLLGEKQIEIEYDGSADEGPFLAEGAHVDDPGRVVEFEDVLSTLAKLTEAINPDDLAVVVDDFLGAFDGQGPTIARSIDAGAEASAVFQRSLDDQVASQRDLSLVAEELSTVSGDFNRLGRTVIQAMPAISENQPEIVALLDELRRFSQTFNATLTVNRGDLDRLIIEGDNVLRLLSDYTQEVGEIVTGLRMYTEGFPEGFQDPTISGQAAQFELIIDADPIADVCEELPPELAGALPACEDDFLDELPPVGDVVPDTPLDLPGVESDADAQAQGEEEQPSISLPRELLRPQQPEEHGADEALRRSLRTPEELWGDMR